MAASWKLLLQEEYNFLRDLSKEQYLEVSQLCSWLCYDFLTHTLMSQIRDTMISLVLGTDMRFHFEHHTKFKTKVQSGTFKPGCSRDDVKFLLSVALHTSDIANPAKPLKYCLQWTELVMEEFFRQVHTLLPFVVARSASDLSPCSLQGDLEQQLGMPISPFYDRSKNNTAQCQIGFINVIVRPLYAEFIGLVGEPAATECFQALEGNLKSWETHGNELFKAHADGLTGTQRKSSLRGGHGGRRSSVKIAAAKG